MTNKKNRFIVIIVGYFLLIIPIIFFIINLNNLYIFSKERAKEALSQKLLIHAQKVEESLNPFNYIKNEFSKIHKELLPDYPQEIINGVPEKSYIANLYNENLFKELLSKTKKRFAPIIVILGSNNLEKLYYYFSPKLNEDCGNLKNKMDLFCVKANYDREILHDQYNELIKPLNLPIKDITFQNNFNPDLIDNRDLDPCYKYISSYVRLKNNYSTIYTDYFNKQNLYPIIKYTFSKFGVHGYYSIIIPQSHIVPKEIVDSALSNNNNTEIKVELAKDKKSIQIKETSDGLEYPLNFSTHFLNHVNSYIKLNNNNINDINYYSELIRQQFKLKINYPQDITFLNNIIYYIKILSLIMSLLYFYIATRLLKNQNSLNIFITKKLICILSIIILLPIISILLFIHLSAQNIDDFIDFNVSKTLNNILEIHKIHDQENSARRVASVFELKKRIAKSELNKENLFNGILSPDEAETWFFNWYNGLLALSDKGESFTYDDHGIKNLRMLEKKNTEYKLYTEIFSRYLNNLGILKKSKDNENNLFKRFSLGLLEQYFSLEQEEKTISQESIPNRDILNFMKKESSIFILAEDIKKTNYLMYTKKVATNEKPYSYISSYTEKINPLWFAPYNRFADINLKIVFRADSNNKIKKWPPFQNTDNEINNSIRKLADTNDSGTEIIKNQEETTIKQWMIEDFDPLMFIGMAKKKKDKAIRFAIDILISIILLYALILLFLLTGFISVFINKPIKIYEKAINKLANYQYGITIRSFSKDEFNYITKAFNEMSIAIKQKEQIKRYVSDKLIESVKDNNVQEAGKGKEEIVTILSSDIRNFTGISEMYEPSTIVEMLNSYFTKMQQAISENNGIIDKYIGDAIQAVFYNEPNKENQIIRASRAALAMRNALIELNKEREKAGLFTIQNGIGIDTDIAITGTIGTTNGRKDFSVNGDVIARAANLEAKTKMTESKILISKKSLSLSINSNNLQEENYSQNPNNGILITKEFDDESVELINVKE